MQKIQAFDLFEEKILTEKQSSIDISYPLLSSLDIHSIIYLEPKFYVLAKIDKQMLTSSNRIVYIHDGNSTIGMFEPHKFRTDLIYVTKFMNPSYLITVGVDTEEDRNNTIKKTSYIKIWEHRTGFVENYNAMTPKKIIKIGKTGFPLQEHDVLSFDVSSDFSLIALSLGNEVILLKSSKNILNENPKEIRINSSKEVLKFIGFTTDINNINHLFGVGVHGVYFYSNCAVKKEILNGVVKLHDINKKGELVCILAENDSIFIFNQDKIINQVKFDEEKVNAKCFGDNHLVAVVRVKKGGDNAGYRIIIYDLLNNFIAYDPRRLGIKTVDHIIVNYPNLFILSKNIKEEKALIKINEIEDSVKLDKMLSKDYDKAYEMAYIFAKNKKYDPQLLAEISLCHANHLYSKMDYGKAIQEYKKTVGYIEPSYVIMKYLDLSQVDLLIDYLELLHKEGFATKEHNAVLFNCYIKQKQIKKFQDFMKSNANMTSDIFDAEAAVRECRESKYFDLALTLAEQCNKEDLYISILIEDQNDFKNAINYIRTKCSLENKIKYLREYGIALMRYEPEHTLQMIKKIIQLSLTKKKKPGLEEKQILHYLSLNEDDWDHLQEMKLYPKPEDYFICFVRQPEFLEEYLLFLKDLTKLYSTKENSSDLYPIYHKLIDHFLKQYSENKSKAIEKKILEILQNPDCEKKYDEKHVLLLFKMYDFGPGITYIYEKLRLREGLLDYYIEKHDQENIINLCKTYGRDDMNLWIQALSYFVSQNYTDDLEIEKKNQKISQLLDCIMDIDPLSPLLVLNICSKEKCIPIEVIRNYFKKKIEDKQKETKKLEEIFNENYEISQKNRLEHKKLLSQGKVYQNQRCDNERCQGKLGLEEPVIYFMCSHAYHTRCISDTAKNHYECLKCLDTSSNILQTKEDLKIKANILGEFMEKLEANSSKFDVVCEFLGRGLFTNNDENIV